MELSGQTITFILFIISIATFYLARKKDNTDDVAKRVEENTKINMKLDEICRNLSDVRLDQKGVNNDISNIKESLIVLENRVSRLESGHKDDPR